MPTCDVTQPGKAAGAVAMADWAESCQFLGRLADSIFLALQESRAVPPDRQQVAALVKMHVEAVLHSLGAFRGYSSTTAAENGRVVRHSWLHVEDIPEWP